MAVQATIRLLLERAGHSVVVAGDGRKGLAIFENGEFDLLFLDIFMPGMDGLETMRLVHQQQPLIPIIVISGNPVTSDSGSGPDFLTMATKLGAVRSLQKALQAGRAAGGRCRFPRGRTACVVIIPAHRRGCFPRIKQNSVDRPVQPRTMAG